MRSEFHELQCLNNVGTVINIKIDIAFDTVSKQNFWPQ